MTTSPADSFRQVFTKTNFHTNKCKDTFLISDLLKVDMISFISKELHFEWVCYWCHGQQVNKIYLPTCTPTYLHTSLPPQEVTNYPSLFAFLSQLWFHRSRLSSVRTLPERLEVRGSGREAEVHEEGLRTASLHRARIGSERSNRRVPISQQRKLSTASSPPSYKVWTAEEEEEVDSYGYVLPGSPSTPERGKLWAVK